MEKQYKNYATKKQAQSNSTYQGNSPYFTNIPEFQHLKPLSWYPHLKQHSSKKKKKEEEFDEY
jgi:hypothetical protein